MLKTSSLLFGLALLAFACSSGETSTEIADAAAPTQDADATSSTALHVSVAIASAILGDEGCSGATESKPSGVAADCAPTLDGGGCTGFACRPSNVQLQFTADAIGSTAHVSVSEVLLLDSSGATLETLSASSPTKWDTATSTYMTWDQTLAPSSEVKASYLLSAPTYSTSSGKSSFSETYRLRITVVIDGTSVVLESADLNREPTVVT